MIPDQSKADFSLALHRNDTFTILDQLEMVSYLTDEPFTLTTQNSTAEISTMIRQTGPPCPAVNCEVGAHLKAQFDARPNQMATALCALCWSGYSIGSSDLTLWLSNQMAESGTHFRLGLRVHFGSIPIWASGAQNHGARLKAPKPVPSPESPKVPNAPP